jgi:hypothetical protein
MWEEANLWRMMKKSGFNNEQLFIAEFINTVHYLLN